MQYWLLVVGYWILVVSFLGFLEDRVDNLPDKVEAGYEAEEDSEPKEVG